MIAPLDDKRMGGGRVPLRPLVALLILVLFLGLGYLAWWGCQPPVKQTLCLPDGTLVSLAAVTYGTVHRFDPTPPLFRLARGLKLPQKVPDVATVTTSRPETRVWLYIRLGETLPADSFFVFEDEHGCPFGDGENDPQSYGDLGAFWGSVAPPAPLNDGRAFNIAAYERASGIELLRLQIPAPAPTPRLQDSQVLEPRPLPQTVTTRELQATLVSVKANSLPEEPHYRATIRAVDSRGAPMSLLTLATEDQYGRRMESLDSFQRMALDGQGFAFMGLCRREPAWKLIATLASEPRKGARPDMQWDYHSLGPSGGRKTLRRGPITLQVDPDYSLYFEAEPDTRIKWVEFQVYASPRTNPCRLAVIGINGRDAQKWVSGFRSTFADDFKPVLEMEMSADSEWKGSFRIPVRQSSRSIHLRIGEFSGKRVEFVVRPLPDNRGRAFSGRNAKSDPRRDLHQ